MLFSVHRLGEQAECLADLGLLLRRDVVLLCKFGLARLGRCASAGGGCFALWRLEDLLETIIPWEILATLLTICALVELRAVTYSAVAVVDVTTDSWW
jgi:hypothetical protein